MSVEELKGHLIHFKKKLVEIQKEYDIYLPRHIETQKKRDELRKLKLKYPETQKMIYEKLSPLRKFFSDPNGPPLNKLDRVRLANMAGRINNLEEWLYNNPSQIERLGEELQATKNSIKTVSRSILAVSKRNEKKAKTRALIASYIGKTRQVANTVRRQIKSQIKKYKNCPYCFKLLGENPHCDHIYPVSRGGLSVQENMVYICANCNKNKKNYTLREFITMNNLDREKIERNLEFLKKRF